MPFGTLRIAKPLYMIEMNRNRLILLTLGLLIILTGIWTFPKIDQFFKADSCLDKGGSWNYETQECEFAEEVIEPVS